MIKILARYRQAQEDTKITRFRIHKVWIYSLMVSTQLPRYPVSLYHYDLVLTTRKFCFLFLLPV